MNQSFKHIINPTYIQANITLPKSGFYHQTAFQIITQSADYLQMQGQQIREDRTEQEQQQLIRQLKDSIELSHSQIHKLLLNQQAFISKIALYNNTSKEKINEKSQLEISEALVYLNQAEKVLEYAAGCGKNINRQLIVCVLHNQACVYQILWELDQCSNYLEALIYNYETFFKQCAQFSLPPSCIYGSGGSQIFTGDKEGQKGFGYAGGSEISYVSKMKDPRVMSRAELKLLNYYFEHCAVSSQLQQNRKALQSAKKGIRLLKNSFIQHKPKLLEEMCSHKTFHAQNSQHKYVLLQQLAEMNQKLPLQKVKQVTKAAHYSLQMWSSNRSLNSQINHEQDFTKILKERLKNLAIGTIMEIVPIAFDKVACEAVEDDYQQSIFSMEEFILRVFFLSVGYFSMATELRLLANSLYKNRKQQQKKASHEYKQSMVYHLIAIIITSLYIPYECRYINDILASYSKHYSCNLQQYKPVDEGSVEKVAELLGVKFKLKDEEKQSENKSGQKMARNTQQTNTQNNSNPTPESNEYHMNCKNTNIQIKTKISKKKQKQHIIFKQYSQQPSSQTDKLKQSRTDLKTSKSKKSRNSSKTSRSKRSNSKQSLNVKDKIQRKYEELQKILSSDNLRSQQEQPKTTKKLKMEKNKQKQKEKEKQKEKNHIQASRDNIKVKKVFQNYKDKDQQKSKIKVEAKPKTQRKTKNSEKKEQEKQQKPSTITEEDQQFFFYMTKKTTKTTNNNILSPKDSIKSIGSSRRSTNKKSSMYSSRSKSKNSPRVFTQSPIAAIQSPISSKGLGGIKKIMTEKKSPSSKVAASIYKNYF